MGCGVSKFNKDEFAGPAYLYYNPVHRQTDDLGLWRHKADRTATIDLASTKQPLVEDADSLAGGGSNGQYFCKSVSATDNGATRDDPSNNVDGCVMKLPPMPQQMIKAEGSEVAVAAKEEEGKAQAGGDKDDNNEKETKANEEDRETRSCNKESSIFYPGSPSFREYCFSSNNTSADADSSSNNNSNDNVGVLNGYVSDDDRGELDIYHQRRDSFTFKTAKEEGIPPSPEFIEKPDEAERTQLEKKSRPRRSRRFRVGLPRNGSAGVRSIWHVTSCSPQRTAGKAAS